MARKRGSRRIAICTKPLHHAAVSRFYTQTGLSAETLLQKDAFPLSSFYREILLHKHRSAFKQTPFTQSPFYTETHLHRDALNKYLLYRDPCTRRPFYTETRFHRDPFKQTPFYAESLSHRDLFTRKPFYVQMRLHTQQLLHSGPSMQRPFYTEQFSCRGSFTHTQAFKHRAALTNRPFAQTAFYTEHTLHTRAFTKRLLSTETLFTQRPSWQRGPFCITQRTFYTRRGFCTETLLHAEAFIRSSFYRRLFYTQSRFNTHAQALT